MSIMDELDCIHYYVKYLKFYFESNIENQAIYKLLNTNNSNNKYSFKINYLMIKY